MADSLRTSLSERDVEQVLYSFITFLLLNHWKMETFVHICLEYAIALKNHIEFDVFI